MAKQGIGIPKGTRDFSPIEVKRRNYIFNTIKNVFRKYGYDPIETPSMEKLSTLLGKYGEEGDKLLFRVLNSGNFLKKVTDNELQVRDTKNLANLVSEKGLRYDLTVPFARYVVQHQNDIVFPFKRYQIQPVWRADRPQRGRYREFYQCDADIVGSDSLLNELEIVQMIDEVFTMLDINSITKVNNRKILSGIAECIGYPDKIVDITVAIDKLDKIGKEKVLEELITKGLSNEAIGKIDPIFDLSKNYTVSINGLKEFLAKSEIGKAGIEEIESLFEYISMFKLKNELELDITLARGLSYYTGAIFEVKAKDFHIGSICGGGRYDDLTGIFGMKGVSGVGISFGADRIYDTLLNLNKFPEETENNVKVMFANFGSKEEKYCLPILSEVRAKGISAEIYPQQAKMKKQMGYADKKSIKYVVLAGEAEMFENKLTLKNMKSGDQKTIGIDDFIKTMIND